LKATIIMHSAPTARVARMKPGFKKQIDKILC